MRKKLLILFFICSIYFFSYFQRVAVPGTIFNELQLQFSVSATAIAALGAIYLYIYGGMQFFAGVMADGFGAGRTLTAGGALLAAGSLLFPLARSLAALYAGRALIGLGASLIYISVLKQIDNLFEPKRFPFFLAVAITLGFSGGLVGTLPFERLVHHMGWRWSLLLAGFACTGAVAGTFLLLRKEGLMNRRGIACRPGMILSVLSNRRTLPVLVSGPINFSIYFLLQATIGKKMLQDFAGMSSVGAAGVTFLMMLLTQGSVMLQGILSQRFSRRKPFLVGASCLSLAAVIVISLGLVFSRSGSWLAVGYLLSAMSTGGVQTATLMKELSPPEASATAVGVYNGFVYLGVALLSNLAGVVMDLFSEHAVRTPGALVYPAVAYEVIFAGCLLLAVFSLAAALAVREAARPA